MKECVKCDEIKLDDEFYLRGSPKKLTKYCKDCIKKSDKERRIRRLMKSDPNKANRILTLHKEKEVRDKTKRDGCSWCYKCKEHVPNEGFSEYNLGNHGSCRNCSNMDSIQRTRKLKLEGIEYLGGCCSICEFIGHYSAFDFHHKDSSTKEFDWRIGRKMTFEKIKKELDKCELLCGNCHSMVHSKLNNNGTLNNMYII